MTALNPEALNAAYAAYHAHAADPGRKGSGVEKAIAAYLSIANPDLLPSPEEQARFVFEGKQMVSVVVARSLPFAKALLHEWSLLDGRDRSHMLKWKSITIEAATYDAILDRVRLRLRPGGLDE